MPQCTDPIATVWVNLMTMLVSNTSDVVRSDNAITAKVQLQETITHLKTIENSLREELQASAQHVRAAQQTQAKTTLQHLLMRARAKRMRLSQTANKRVNMEQQLDALCMSELNNQVLSSMQKTSIALKSLGVRESVENADDMMLDMQEAQQDLSAMQDALGQPLNFDSIDEEALAHELQILLTGDEDTLLEVPLTENRMRVKANTEAPQAEGAETAAPVQPTQPEKAQRPQNEATIEAKQTVSEIT